MKKFVALAGIATLASLAAPTAAFAETSQSVRAVTAEAATPASVTAGKMLFSTDGGRLAAVYRVDDAGNPQLILNGRLVTVPVATLSEVDGKLVTTLTKKDIASAK